MKIEEATQKRHKSNSSDLKTKVGTENAEYKLVKGKENSRKKNDNKDRLKEFANDMD